MRVQLVPYLLSGVLLFSAAGALADGAQAEKKIPKPPYYYVLDEPKVLDRRSLSALQTLLIEHDRLTGEQFLIAIFNSLEGEDLVQFTNKVFSSWKIGKRGKDNGILLALYWKDRKARIEVGYGLEPILTDAKSSRVLSEVLIPELKEGRPGIALSLAAFEILKTLESPLIVNGQAQEILKTGGVHRNPYRASYARHFGSIWWLLLIPGLFLIMGVLYLITAADAHYSRGGLYRSSPWRRSGGGGFGGFGGFGSGGGGGFGGFGGFSGGGGLSGGGGASGSW